MALRLKEGGVEDFENLVAVGDQTLESATTGKDFWGANGANLADGSDTQPGTSIVTEAFNEGTKSLKSLIIRGDYSNGTGFNGGFRSELQLKANSFELPELSSAAQQKLEFLQSHWFGIAIKMGSPTLPFVIDRRHDSIVQMTKASESSIPLGIQTADPLFVQSTSGSNFTHWKVNSRKDAHGVPGHANSFLLDPIISNKWERFVFNYRLANLINGDPVDGFIKCWQNGVLLVDYVGGVGGGQASGESSSSPKIGNYKAPWNNEGTPSSTFPGVSPRVVFYDSVRFGDPNSSFAEVDPAQLAAPEIVTVKGMGRALSGGMGRGL